jgi:PAS domain S-box-containing protein
MAETVGYDREEMLGMHAGTVLGTGEYERGQVAVQELVADSGRESEVLEFSIETADGEELPVAIHFAPLYDEDGDYDGLVGVLRDISTRKERERRLRESEQRYRALAENIPNGAVAMFDSDLRYTLVGGELFERLEYGIDAFEGATLSTIHTAAYMEQFGSLYESVFDGERSSFEFTHDNRQYRTNLVPLRSPDGAVDAGLALVVDVTEQREYERELERQNQRLGEFASIVSHDLRNPLNVIEGRLQLYRETGDEDHLDAVEHSAERMGNLINDLLELARQGQTVGEVDAFDIAELVTRCCESVDTGDATIVTDDPGTVTADAARLGQLLTNLFRNSVEHAGPDVTVRVGGLPDGFYVEDDGPGIAPERREEVLEYGVTDSADGTGIGLAIVAEIAEAHGWTVTVTESDSGGARFEFTGVDRTEASPVQTD